MGKPKKILEDIEAAHPRMDISLFKEILLKVDEVLSRNRRPTQTELARSLRKKRSLICSRVGILEKHGYLEQAGRTASGGTVLFLAVEGERPIFDRQEQDRVIEEEGTVLIGGITKDKRIKKVVSKGLIDAFLRYMKQGSFAKALRCYETIIEALDLKGMKGGLNEMKLKRRALRIVLTIKGELEAAKIKEKQESKSSSKESEKNKSENEESGEAVA